MLLTTIFDDSPTVMGTLDSPFHSPANHVSCRFLIIERPSLSTSHPISNIWQITPISASIRSVCSSFFLASSYLSFCSHLLLLLISARFQLHSRLLLDVILVNLRALESALALLYLIVLNHHISGQTTGIPVSDPEQRQRQALMTQALRPLRTHHLAAV